MFPVILCCFQARIKGIKSCQSTDEDAELEDLDALIGESDELEAHIALRNKRIDEINERRSWNADNICQTKEEKTIVNAQISSSLRAVDFVPTGATDKAFSRDTSTTAAAAADSATTTASNVKPAATTGKIVDTLPYVCIQSYQCICQYFIPSQTEHHLKLVNLGII